MMFDDGSYGHSSGRRHTGKNIRPVYNPKESTGIYTMTAKERPSIAYSEGKLTVRGLSKPAIVKVNDLSGRTFRTANLCNGQSVEMELPRGFYVVSVSDEAGAIVTKKLTIKK